MLGRAGVAFDRFLVFGTAGWAWGNPSNAYALAGSAPFFTNGGYSYGWTAKLARMGEHGRPILGDVFVQQDARFGLAQQPRQRRLPVQEWEIAQILVIMLDQVEGVEDRGSSGLASSGPPYHQRAAGISLILFCGSIGCS